MTFILSHFQATPLLIAHKSGQSRAETSLDLGRSQAPVALGEAGVTLPNGEILEWAAVAEIAEDENSCFLLESSGPRKIQHFSEGFNRLYTLYPTPGPPTMLISGIPMHRIKETDPGRDTQAKMRAAGRLTGPVLDTATGLGYTAIAAARMAERVVTIELDPAAQEICRQNPWSQELFTLANLEQRIGDSEEVVEGLEAGSFAHVVHDPPMFSLAGHLYGLAFYQQLWRILRPRGTLFHYIGNPESKSGRTVTAGVLRRLEEAGFAQIRRAPQAFGVTARKP